ncbi:hypothetical protein C453_12681 [Haloferax elongans ATCC BAA-1513]|uniref:Uncharacterized protein n=1 Tax=Haloferax elongans ATCC BAA-1513 TaxID=1230453 RepID=M0HIT0_HALEO|nr:hypothetical protein [Haloferax elongans]ELZ84401.1 hypothetical protein C453_12681 [Haloferax elongans ATCC BAA-1513]
MGIFRFLREWKEKANGVLTGPTLEAGEVTAETATLTDLIASESIKIPQYDATANAPRQSGIIEVPPSGSDTAGFYRYDSSSDSYELLDQSGGVSAGDLSGLNIDTDKDWGGFEITNVGPNGRDVPASVEQLTVTDWSDPVEDEFYRLFGGESDFTTQDSVALSGNALKMDVASGARRIVGTDLNAVPQMRDVVEVPFYFTDTSDILEIDIGRQGSEVKGRIQFDAKSDVIDGFAEDGNTTYTTQADISSHLNEWLVARFEWLDTGQVNIRLLVNSDGTELAYREMADFSTMDGLFAIGGFNRDNPSTIYVESPVITNRHVSDHVNEASAGVVELGGDVVRPQGALDAGPHEAVVSDTTVHGHLRTDNALLSGADVSLVEWDGGYGQRRLEAQADGEGGFYGLRRPLADRINNRLLWQYESLSDVPELVTGADVTSASFALTGYPRRLQIAHDGSDAGNLGAFFKPIISPASVGSFRLTFHNVIYSSNDLKNQISIGLSDIDPTTSTVHDSGNALIYNRRPDGSGGKYEELQLNDGTKTAGGMIVDWSTPHDISFEYDANQSVGRGLVDGELAEELSKELPDKPMHPVIQLVDSSASTGETLECELITVEVM